MAANVRRIASVTSAWSISLCRIFFFFFFFRSRSSVSAAFVSGTSSRTFFFFFFLLCSSDSAAAGAAVPVPGFVARAGGFAGRRSILPLIVRPTLVRRSFSRGERRSSPRGFRASTFSLTGTGSAGVAAASTGCRGAAGTAASGSTLSAGRGTASSSITGTSSGEGAAAGDSGGTDGGAGDGSGASATSSTFLSARFLVSLISAIFRWCFSATSFSFLKWTRISFIISSSREDMWLLTSCPFFRRNSISVSCERLSSVATL